VAAPLLTLLGTGPAQAATLCLPQPDKTSCISSTMGSRADPITGVDVTLTKPDGSKETVTTGDDGKWSFQVTAPGSYTLTVDEATLPKGMQMANNTRTVKVTKLGGFIAANLQVRSADYSASESKWDEVAQNAVNGIRLGLLLAMASLGLSLIYGTTGLSNFAHAELVTLGGVVGYFAIAKAGLDLWLGGLVVVVFCGLVGFLQDRLMWQPLRNRGLGLTQMMIVTIGLSLAAQYIFQYVIGAGTVKLVGSSGDSVTFGPVVLTYRSMVAMLISLVMIAGVGFALLRTRFGRATRAVSDNPALASASGIDVDRVIRLVWTVASALAGLAGLLYALVVQSGGVKWDSGLQILLLLFAAVTLGGLGTAFGALIGSLVIGLVVELASVAGVPGNLKYAVALALMILLLIVRPQGLLGRAQRVG
jgi:branched-chain amino acid transport system permease protein